MSYHPISTTLLVFEDNLQLIDDALKTNVIRIADKLDRPYEPLRKNKEITMDGEYVVPDSFTGISLAALMKQIERIFRIGDKRWLLTVDRNSCLPSGFAFRMDNEHHWSLIVTAKIHITEYRDKLHNIIMS